MSELSDQGLHAGDEIGGFVVVKVTPLPEQRLLAYQLEHRHSGARLLHLSTDDAENLFSISFSTPPPDDTGVPHILEHSVLSGSRKYPVRDPFFEMIKMSMATFINAMTGFDTTYYPVSSNVKEDLFNLADVYFDAVFHPLLSENTFKREAHHLAPLHKEQPTGALTVNGIVYNEMKGAYSNPEATLYERMCRTLLPDTIYSRDSGGDPRHIPELTYDGLRHFHQTFYHPGNAYFVLYGDIPTADYLAFLDDKLNAFPRQPGQPPVARQPAWTAPREWEDGYPVGQGEALTEKTYLMSLWKVGDAANPTDGALLRILNLLLLGNEGAPLKKALIDSKLGQTLLFSGDVALGCELAFAVVLKGSEPERREAYERLVLDTLAAIAAQPFTREQVDAAFQQAGYYYREILPLHPLHVLDRVLEGWVYGADPLTFLCMSEYLHTCRRCYEDDPLLFNRLIRERLLENPHRLLGMQRPDPDKQAAMDTAFAEHMRQIREGLSEEEMCRIAADAEALEESSATPNTPEQLATLPQLQVGDLPPVPKHIPTTRETLTGGAVLLRNEVFANGVNYLQLDFDLHGLPAALWPWLPCYLDALGKMGAAGMDYARMSHRVAAATGGIHCWPSFSTHAVDAMHSLRSLRLSCKVLDEQVEPALGVLHDLLFAVDPRDRERLRDVATQELAENRTRLVYSGLHTAGTHAARGIHAEGYLAELTVGLPQLAQSEALVAQFATEHEALMEKIEAIRDFILARGRVTASFTGSAPAYDRVRDTLDTWLHAMREEPVVDAPLGFTPYATPPREGLAAPIQVAHCAQVMPAPHYSHPDEPLLRLGASLVSLDFFMSEIRFRGNAYGAFCGYDPGRRQLTFASYQDPHITSTLRVFATVCDYVQRVPWAQVDIDRAIITAARDDEKPIRPEEATGTALQRYLAGQTAEWRNERTRRLRTATPSKVKRALLDTLEANQPRSAICVVSSREKLEAANRELDDALVIETIAG